MNWKLDEKSRPSKIVYCLDRQEYSDEFSGHEETCHSHYSEIPAGNVSGKYLQGVK